MNVPKELGNLRLCLLVSLVKVRCLEHVQKVILVSSIMKSRANRHIVFLTCHSLRETKGFDAPFSRYLRLSVQTYFQIFNQCPWNFHTCPICTKKSTRLHSCVLDNPPQTTELGWNADCRPPDWHYEHWLAASKMTPTVLAVSDRILIVSLAWDSYRTVGLPDARSLYGWYPLRVH